MARKRKPWLVKLKGEGGRTAYGVRWSIPGRHYRQKVLGPKWKAEKYRDFVETQLNDGWMSPQEKPPVEFEVAVQEYLENKTGRVAKATVGAAKWTLNRFKKYMKPNLLLDVDVEMIERYVNRRLKADGVRPATVTKEMRHLRAAFNHWLALEYVEGNPVLKVVPPRVITTEKPVLTRVQSKKLLEVCSTKGTLLHASISILLETGMRIDEAANLQRADVDFENRLIRIRPKADWVPKGRRERVVAISEDAGGLLFELRDRMPYILAGTSRCEWKDKVRKELAQSCREAGITVVHPHDLRRTAATLMVEDGVNQDDVQTVMGHVSYQTTKMFYIRSNAEQAAKRALAARQRAERLLEAEQVHDVAQGEPRQGGGESENSRGGSS